MFDLTGYSHVPNALGAEELRSINDWIDALGPVDGMGEWYGRVQSHSYYHDGRIDDGINLQHMFEAGPAFEALVDHPAWIGRVDHYVRGASVHEMFLNLRGQGGYIGCHCGGPAGMGYDPTYSSGIIGGKWAVQYMSLIVALQDIGPGDGATVLVPGSHKSEIAHPTQQMMTTEGTEVEGAVEVHMAAGDMLLFNDSCLHGAAARTNVGQRRVLCMRYLPSRYQYRWPYTASPELLDRLTPRRKALLSPVLPREGGAMGGPGYSSPRPAAAAAAPLTAAVAPAAVARLSAPPPAKL